MPESTEESRSLHDLSPEQLEEAKRYGRLELVCHLADKAIDLTYLAVMAFALAAPLDRFLMLNWGLDYWTRLVVFFLIVFLLHELVSFPLALYSGFILERRFGLSNLSLARWLGRHFARYTIGLVFSLLLFLGLFAIIFAFEQRWWLVAAAAYFFVGILVGQLAPVVFLPLFYTIKRLDRPDLAERMEKLADGTGLAIEGVYSIALSEETAKANAMLAGLGRTRRVLMGDTLMEQFSPEEIDVIFAHEIGHHVHRHIPKLMVVGAFFSLAGFFLCHSALAARLGWAPNDAIQIEVSALPLLMFLLAVFGTLMEPLQNAISRRFERQSDSYALRSTNNREAYVLAFQKLARLNKDDPHPHRLEVMLFHSHPPIAERLAAASS